MAKFSFAFTVDAEALHAVLLQRSRYAAQLLLDSVARKIDTGGPCPLDEIPSVIRALTDQAVERFVTANTLKHLLATPEGKAFAEEASALVERHAKTIADRLSMLLRENTHLA